jgi:hypothetical protein
MKNNVTITESWDKEKGTQSICFDLQVFKPGDFIVITYDGHGRVYAPGFKEAGLKGGLVVHSCEKWEKWSDKDLEKGGLKRI